MAIIIFAGKFTTDPRSVRQTVYNQKSSVLNCTGCNAMSENQHVQYIPCVINLSVCLHLQKSEEAGFMICTSSLFYCKHSFVNARRKHNSEN